MSPILLRLGPIVIHSYAALVNAGLLLGAGLVVHEARRREIDLARVIDAILGAALVGLVLAHATYVGAHWEYYGEHLREALRPWTGGLLGPGAVLGGAIGAGVVGRLRGLPAFKVLDVLAPGAACLTIFAWLACFMVGCAWGIEAYPDQGLLWAMSLDQPDLYGIREPRVAVQLLGAGWSAIVLVILLVWERRPRRQGVAFSLWLTLHSLGSFGLGFLGPDQLLTVAGWRVDQLANLALGVAGVVLLASRLVNGRRGVTA